MDYKSKNVNNFSDFIDNINAEKEELKKVNRSIDPNTPDEQQNVKNSKLHFNSVTRKMDDLTKAEIKDKLDKLDESLNKNDDNQKQAFMKGYLHGRLDGDNENGNDEDFDDDDFDDDEYNEKGEAAWDFVTRKKLDPDQFRIPFRE